MAHFYHQAPTATPILALPSFGPKAKVDMIRAFFQAGDRVVDELLDDDVYSPVPVHRGVCSRTKDGRVELVAHFKSTNKKVHIVSVHVSRYGEHAYFNLSRICQKINAGNMTKASCLRMHTDMQE